MSTIVMVKKNGHIALAADSQSTFGETKISAHYDACYNKIFRLEDNLISISGSAAHDLVLQSALKQLKRPDLSSRMTIFETFRRLHTILKNDYFLQTSQDEEDPYESSQMEVFIANPFGIFSVYSMREVYEYQRFWCMGSGRDFALGALYAGFDGELSAAELAQLGVQAGAEFDTASSLPMTLFTIEAFKK